MLVKSTHFQDWSLNKTQTFARKCWPNLDQPEEINGALNDYIFNGSSRSSFFSQAALTALSIIQAYFTSSHRARIHPPGCRSRSCSHSTSWRNQSGRSAVSGTPETQSAEVQLPHSTLSQLNVMHLGQYGARNGNLSQWCQFTLRWWHLQKRQLCWWSWPVKRPLKRPKWAIARLCCVSNTGLWCEMQAGSKIYTCCVPKAIVALCQLDTNFIRFKLNSKIDSLIFADVSSVCLLKKLNKCFLSGNINHQKVFFFFQTSICFPINQ